MNNEAKVKLQDLTDELIEHIKEYSDNRAEQSHWINATRFYLQQRQMAIMKEVAKEASKIGGSNGKNSKDRKKV